MNASTLRSAAVTALSCAGFVLVGALVACGQAAEPQSGGSGTSESTSSTTAALNTVIGCQQAEFACAADAAAPTDIRACQQELQTCLGGLLPGLPGLDDAGFPTPPTAPTLPIFDASFPTPPTAPTFPTPPTPPRFDAGFPTPPAPPPVTLPDAGGTQAECLLDLQQCLFAGTAPTMCATDARTCLQAVQAAQCDQQEQACVAAKLPQNVCDAQRKACSP
jgi:hypothetical protein